MIAGYSEQIAVEGNKGAPDVKRNVWLEMRTTQAREVAEALDVTDDATVAQALMEYSAIVVARDRHQHLQQSNLGGRAHPAR